MNLIGWLSIACISYPPRQYPESLRQPPDTSQTPSRHPSDTPNTAHFLPIQGNLETRNQLVYISPLHYSLSPSGIWKLRICKNYDLGCHFLKPALFQMKIFGFFLLFSFAFNSYLGTSRIQSSAAAKIAKESVAIQTGCGLDADKVEGTS